MKKLALVVFVVSFLGVVASAYLEIQWVQWISKPLIMASLLLYYITSVDALNRSTTVILAIVLSLAGDVLLMKNEYFIAGLIAFLLAHLFYIFSYNQHRYEESGNALLGIQRV